MLHCCIGLVMSCRCSQCIIRIIPCLYQFAFSAEMSSPCVSCFWSALRRVAACSNLRHGKTARERDRERASLSSKLLVLELRKLLFDRISYNQGMVMRLMRLMRLMRFCGRFPTSSPRWRGTGPAKVSFFSRSVMASVLSRNHPLKKAMATWPACELVWVCEVASKII